VRSAPLIAILVLGTVVVAKDPPSKGPSSERKLLDRLENPEEKSFNLNQMSAFGRSKSDFQARGANTDSFYIWQKFQAKGYQTEAYQTKSAWDGNFKFSTKDARTKTFDTKAAPGVKAAPVKESPDSKKSAATREFADANKASTFKGRHQSLFDAEGPAAQAKIGVKQGWNGELQSWSGNLKTLTVDDVREILNKNK
jgi:hypothetical protein